jgi:hypothetical protein
VQKERVVVKLDEAHVKSVKRSYKRYSELIPRHEGLWFAATWWAQIAFPLSVMHADAPLHGPRPKPVRGDYFVVREYIRAWFEAAREQRLERQRDSRWDAAQREFDRRLKEIEERWAKKYDLLKETIADKDKEIAEANKEIRKLENSLQKEKRENERLRREAEEREAIHRNQIEQLERRIEEGAAVVAGLKAKLAEAEQAILDAEERFRLMQAKLQDEIAGMKEQIRKMQLQLKEALITLKQSRELQLRAKRDASGTVSAERFAELIADLEEIRDKLAVLGRECEYEREKSAWLNSKLEQNRRRLELERQFLPLLHKVRGPVGPKNKMLKSKNADLLTTSLGPPPEPPPDVQKRMNQSLSASTIDNMRASTASAGGRAMTGAQARQAMSASDGFNRLGSFKGM